MKAGLLLAAGESTRMGSPKPLLDWFGQPLVQYQIKQLREGGCDTVVVVLGACADRILPFADVPGAQIVINHRYREGRATSVRAGAEAIPGDATLIAVLGVDQPRPAKLISQVLSAAEREDARVTVPIYKQRRGHPIVFSGRLLGELREVDDATLGLRAVMRRHLDAVLEVPVDDSIVLLDLNTPQDYQAARFGRALATGR